MCGFDLSKEPNYVQKVWVLLPGLPWELWHSQILMNVGNLIGQFISFEDGWEEKSDRRMACILVELDLQEGLLAELDIVWGGVGAILQCWTSFNYHSDAIFVMR